MKRYCEECKKEVETTIVTKKESYNVCGEMIDVNAQVLVCAECGEELFSEELDNATLINAYNEYRRRHKLLLPEEIKEIRQQYGLSQRGFSKLLKNFTMLMACFTSLGSQKVLNCLRSCMSLQNATFCHT